MDNTFSVAQSGMVAAQIRHDVTANNVANVNTDKFQASTVVQSDENPGTRIAAIQKTPNDTPYSNTDLTVEIPNMMVNKNVYGANTKVFHIQDQMLGEAIDLVA